MSERVDDNLALRELLPFHANGTLAGAECARLDEALAADPELAAELAELRTLKHWLAADATDGPARELGLARLHRAIDEGPGGRDLSQWRRLAASALFGGIVATASFMLWNAARAPVYVQSGVAGDAHVLTVAFRPEARLGAMEALMQAEGLSILDGPSAIGLYRIEVPVGGDPAEVAGLLRAAEDVVESVELRE